MNEKTLLLITGPIGAGKTLFTTYLLDNGFFKGFEYVNADIYMKLFFQNSVIDEDIQYKKGKEFSYYKINKLVDLGRNFIWETLVVKEDKVNFIKLIKKRGYKIITFFIGVDGYTEELLRVKRRFDQGWYNVPSEKVINRYNYSLIYLKSVMSVSDYIFLIDNTNTYQLGVFLCNDKQIVYKKFDWFDSILLGGTR